MKARTVHILDSDIQDLSEKRLFKVVDGCSYTSMGQTCFRRWAKEIGAEKHIGRSVFYDKQIIDKALDELK